MAQIFRPGADTLARFALASLAVVPVLAVGLAHALWRSPYATGQDVTREQPVPFSHEHHVGGLGLDCRYCHTSVEKAALAGIPPTETCMTCHSQVWTNAPMLAPVRTSLAEGRPLEWLGWRDATFLAENPQVEVTALYWHLVDIVWIFAYPLIYLPGRDA